MRGQIKEVLSGLNKATVIVTHDQLEALTMADRIAVMRGGVIEQVASPHEIFARPANLFVAGFIGTPQMNLLPATLIGRRERERRASAPSTRNSTLPVPAGVGAIAPDGAVTLGVRPRGMELVSEPGGQSVGLGRPDRTHGRGKPAASGRGGQDLRVVVDRSVRVAPGERLHVRFRPGQTHVFDEFSRQGYAMNETGKPRAA